MLKAQVIGNLGTDPEIKYTSDGTAVLSLRLASNYRAKDQSGEWVDKTEWVRCTVFGKRAETLGEYLKKGSKVYVDGRLEARPWINRDGQPNAGLELLADTVEFFSPRNDAEQRQAPVVAGNRVQRADDDDTPF